MRRKTQRKVKRNLRGTTKTFRNAKVKQAWDLEKTTEQNYKELRLISRRALNNAAPGKRIEDVPVPKEDDSSHMFADVKPEEPGQSRLRRRFHVTKGEADYLRPLIEKYGEDYTAMFRDIKMNYKQHTKKHLRRRCVRLHLDDEDVKNGSTAEANPSGEKEEGGGL